MHRRDLFTRFVPRVAGPSPEVVSDGSDHNSSGAHLNTASCECSRPQNGPYAHHFPNIVVQTHQGQRALFYDDLLRGKMVMINCISVKDRSLLSLSKNLAEVQRLLRDRLGRDLFMYSITIDPEHDTPRVLKAFAEQLGAGPGWMFLTGESAGILTLRNRLFISGGGHNHTAAPGENCSLAMIRYGNEAVGLWGSVPANADPQSIAMRLSWIRPGKQATGTPRRAGPPPLA